ncbi:hypothetical protein Hanom_Chr10g00934891 [Helianthus anomalus]
MSFSSLRFGQFCDFRLKVCFFRIWIQKVRNLAIFIQLLNSIYFSPLSQGYFHLFANLKGNSVFSILCKKTKYPLKRLNCPLS